jgi:DNA-binding NarL/FixJ family response regulator
MHKRTYKTDYKLTLHQTEIVKYVAKGFDNKTIAELLVIDKETVRWHIFYICKTLNIYERTLPIYALKKGIIALKDINLHDLERRKQ